MKDPFLEVAIQVAEKADATVETEINDNNPFYADAHYIAVYDIHDNSLHNGESCVVYKDIGAMT